MKRILTLALAALFVVAFAIPAFAAPKIELVGGTVETLAYWNATDGWWGAQDMPLFSDLKFKLSADNFVVDLTVEPLIFITTDYNFALTLPFMALTGNYTEDNNYGYHAARYLKLASDAKFQELAGFNWSVYADDDNITGPFDSVHAKIGVPVDAFTGTLEYVYNVPDEVHAGYITGLYNFTDTLYAKATVGKNLDTTTDNFGFYAEVGAPIVEGFKVIGKAFYGMANTVDPLTTDALIANPDKYSTWAADKFLGSASFRYNNEATNAEVYAAYQAKADFTTAGKISARAEYVNNGDIYAVSGWWEPEYADSDWNASYEWVRGNSGNDFSVEADGYYELDGTYAATLRGMFAPDVVPVVFTLKGNYTSEIASYDTDGAGPLVATSFDYVKYSVDGYLGVRINPDIHLAFHGNYLNNDLVVDFVAPSTDTDIAAIDDFTLDTALVYNRDSVTASVTALDLTDFVANGGVELYVGISF